MNPHVATNGRPRRISPRDAARVLFRRWRVFATVFAAISGLTLLAITVYPRSYGSEAKLMIRVGRESVALDPTATTGQTIMLQKTQDAEVNTALDILNSAALQKRVVESVGVNRILADDPAAASTEGDAPRPSTNDSPSRLDTWLRSLRLSEPGDELDLALRRIEKGLRASAGKNSTVISVKYTAVTPELARDVVAAVTDTFLAEHVRLNRTNGSLGFFTEQEAQSAAALAAAQNELRDHKIKYNVASGETEQALLAEQVKSVELELLQTARSLSYSIARIADLKSQIADLKPEVVTNRVAGMPNEAKDGMREKLYELELKEGQLRSRFTDEHPLVHEVEKQRESAGQILESLPDERIHTTEALNTNQRKLELSLAEERATERALVARKKVAATQLEELNGKVRTLNEEDVILTTLERKVKLLEDRYRMHAAKLEEARVNDALEQERITNVNVVQPATLVRKPVWPNKRLFLMLGLVMATGGAFGVAVVLEGLDQTLRTATQVEKELGLPVLLSLPRRRKRKRRLRRALARITPWNSSRGAAGGRDIPSRRQSAGSYGPLISQLVRTGQLSGKASRFVGVVGCHGEHCRSRVASELALRATLNGSRDVLLIDADARHRRVAKRFHLNGSPGFHEVLAGVAEAESCIHRPRNSNLAVMGYGGSNGHGSELTTTCRSEDQLDGLKKNFRLIVVDLPSTADLHTQSTTAEWVDEALLVVEAERTRVQSAQSVLRQLERAEVRVLGVVLANRRDYVPGWLYRRL